MISFIVRLIVGTVVIFATIAVIKVILLIAWVRMLSQ